MKKMYLLPNVFELFYTFSYFFQTSIDFTCGGKKMCSTITMYEAVQKLNFSISVQCARQDSAMDPRQQ